jgi:hypothetical protein
LNIKVQGVAPHDPQRLGKFRVLKRITGDDEIRELPLSKYSTQISIETGKSWVKIHDFANLQGLIIENPAFAKTMREIFEIVWKSTGEE